MVDAARHVAGAGPLGTFAASLLLFLPLAGFLLLLVRNKRFGGESRFGWVAERLYRLDERIVANAASMLGLLFESIATRIAYLTSVLLLMVIGSVFAPWPLSLFVLIIALLLILLIWRTWAVRLRRERAEARAALAPREEPGQPAGTPAPMAKPATDDLGWLLQRTEGVGAELAIAVSMLFVIMPVAFSHMQVAGVGLHLDRPQGPFTFLFYLINHLLKPVFSFLSIDLWQTWISIPAAWTPEPASWISRLATIVFRYSFEGIVVVFILWLFEKAEKARRDQVRASGDKGDLERLLSEPMRADADGQANAVDELVSRLTSDETTAEQRERIRLRLREYASNATGDARDAANAALNPSLQQAPAAAEGQPLSLAQRRRRAGDSRRRILTDSTLGAKGQAGKLRDIIADLEAIAREWDAHAAPDKTEQARVFNELAIAGREVWRRSRTTKAIVDAKGWIDRAIELRPEASSYLSTRTTIERALASV